MSGGLFSHPEWSAAVWGVLVVAASVLGVAALDRRSRTQRWLGNGRIAVTGDVLLWLALAAIALGLLGPRLAKRNVAISTAGIDLVVLLDISRSMEARDNPPSRAIRAQHAARAVLEALPAGDRVALAAYSGRGVLLTPLTPDKSALVEMLPALDADLIHPGGSNLPDGALATLRAFARRDARPRVVLWLGDGESSSNELDAALSSLQGAEVRVVAALLGSDEGATIDDHGTPLRDLRGEVVVTHRHRALAARLADATDGRVFEADAWGEFATDALVDAIRRDVGRAPGEIVEREVVSAATIPFAVAAAILLLLEAIATGSPPSIRARRGAAATLSSITLVVVLAGLPAPSRGRTDEPAVAPLSGVSAERLLAQGLADAEALRFDAARRRFQAAAVLAGDRALAAIAYHDLGVVALEQRDYETARDAFFDALALAPGRVESRYNLEWTLLALERRARRPPPGGDERSDDDPNPPAPREDEAPDPGEGETTEGDEDAAKGTGDDDSSGEAAPPRNEASRAPNPTRRPPEARPEPLSPEERERWMGRITDDPAAALRAAAAPEPGEATGSANMGPRW